MAKYNLELLGRRALVYKGGVVMSESKGGRTRMLEEQRVKGRLTHLWAVIMVPTAQLVRAQSLAPTLTRHHGSVTRGCTVLQRWRTRAEQIRATAHHRTHPFALVWGHRHGDVKTVHEAHAVRGEVVRAVVDAELGQSRRSHAAGAVALQPATAVAGRAVELVVGISASGSGPDPAGPVAVGYGYGDVGESVEDEAAASEDRVAGVGLDAGPDGEVAVVN